MTTNGDRKFRTGQRRAWISMGAWAALCAVVAACVLLALPDRGPRLVAFSGAHGLTAQDAVGAALLVAAWLAVVSRFLRRRERRARLRTWPRRTVASFATGLGGGLVVASAARDFSGWWAVGAGLLIVVQIAAYQAVAGSVQAPSDDAAADEAPPPEQPPKERTTATTRP